MKNWVFSHISIFIASVIIMVFCLWFALPFYLKSTISVTPLPSYLSLPQNNQVTSLELWLPKEKEIVSSQNKPDITANAAFMYDLTTNQVMYAKNIKNKYPMASLTKIMTAIVALEYPVENNRYLVDADSLVGEDSMGLTDGEVLSLEELLYGLMLPSGNDASEVLAGNYRFGRNAFVAAMNEKAKSLGFLDTHFTNPSGLQGDGNQYTTARDLLIMTRYALSRFELFRRVVATPYYEIVYTPTHKYFYLENETNLLTSYPGVKGVKTGYTPEAGLCLVTYYQNNGHELIGVVLGSLSRRDDMKNLLDYSLKVLGVSPTVIPK